MIAIVATIAKQERVRHIQRVKAGMDHVKQTGQTKSGEGKSKARSEQS